MINQWCRRVSLLAYKGRALLTYEEYLALGVAVPYLTLTGVECTSEGTNWVDIDLDEFVSGSGRPCFMFRVSGILGYGYRRIFTAAGTTPRYSPEEGTMLSRENGQLYYSIGNNDKWVDAATQVEEDMPASNDVYQVFPPEDVYGVAKSMTTRWTLSQTTAGEAAGLERPWRLRTTEVQALAPYRKGLL